MLVGASNKKRRGTMADEKSNGRTIVTLSTGVVLEGLRVSPWLLAEQQSKLKEPKVPKVFIEAKGREEENPNDPTYLAEVEEYYAKQREAGINAALWMGTRLATVPDGMSRPEANEWVEQVEALGIEVPKVKPGRYVAWLKYIAAVSREDMAQITRLGYLAMGTTEEAVAVAMESFRSDEAGGVDLAASPQQPEQDRDGDSSGIADRGDSPGVRGAGSGGVLPVQPAGVSRAARRRASKGDSAVQASQAD